MFKAGLDNIHNKSLLKAQDGRNTQAQAYATDSHLRAHQNMGRTTGIQYYSATPKSILQENPVLSETGIKSLQGGTEYASLVSVTDKHKSSPRGSQVGGLNTQRVKLPNLRNLNNVAQGKNTLPVADETHNNIFKANALRSSITTKNNNVFTTLDGENGRIVEKRIANNF